MFFWAILNAALGVLVGFFIRDIAAGWPLLVFWGAFAIALPTFTSFVMLRFLPARSERRQSEATPPTTAAPSETSGATAQEKPEGADGKPMAAEQAEPAASEAIESAGKDDSETNRKKGRFTQRCDEISSQYLLSRRETEVFYLLAKGHNAAFIQEKLCVSRSTAKTHINHIYRKLDIHTQQELLNMIEDRPRPGGDEFHVFGSSPGAMNIDNPRDAMEQAIERAAKKRPANYRTDIFTKQTR